MLPTGQGQLGSSLALADSVAVRGSCRQHVAEKWTPGNAAPPLPSIDLSPACRCHLATISAAAFIKGVAQETSCRCSPPRASSDRVAVVALLSAALIVVAVADFRCVARRPSVILDDSGQFRAVENALENPQYGTRFVSRTSPHACAQHTPSA